MKQILIVFSCVLLMSCAEKSLKYVTIEAYNSEQVMIDGKQVKIEDIHTYITDITTSLDSLQKAQFYVKLKIDKNTTVGVVSDIKYQLRKANTLRVKYYNEE